MTLFFFQSIYEHLGGLLTALITLDGILDGNPLIREHFHDYQRLVRTSLQDPTKYGVTKGDMKGLEEILEQLEESLFGEGLFMVRQNRGLKPSDRLVRLAVNLYFFFLELRFPPFFGITGGSFLRTV